jgi:hypothetical protein
VSGDAHRYEGVGRGTGYAHPGSPGQLCLAQLAACSTPHQIGPTNRRLETPGTYDCEVISGALRCMVFASRKPKPARERFEKLVQIVRASLPVGIHHGSGWNDRNVGDAGGPRCPSILLMKRTPI